MAETNTTRLGLRRWSADTDTPSRNEFDTSFANLEELTAIDKQGPFLSRPSAGVRGTYYWDTTNQYLWRDDGVTWSTVGSRTLNAIIRSSAGGVVPLTIDTPSSPVANLLELRANTSLRFSVTPDGLVTATGRYVGTGISLTNTSAGTRIIDVIAAPGQSTDVLRIRTSSSGELLRVSQAGVVTGAYLNAGDRSLLGNNVFSSVANHSKFNGTPALEVYSTRGGAGMFNDFLYLRHQAADGTSVSRRFGILIKVGDESAGDAARTGAFYIESSAGNFNNPSLVLNRANNDVMTFDSTPLATIHHALSVQGSVTAATGTDHSYLMGNGAIGMQGTNMLFRTGNGSSFYWYSGGTYNATPGNPGGGGYLADLSSNGVFTATGLRSTSTSNLALSQSSPAVMVGAGNSTNLILSREGMQARNNGSSATLNLNPNGGIVNIGAASNDVVVLGNFHIGTRQLSIQSSAPSSPSIGDVWISI